MEQDDDTRSSALKTARTALLSVVVPVYNEQQVLLEFHRRLSAVLDSMPLKAVVVYVNDGSTDETLAMMHQLRSIDPRIALIDLSRNFGKEIALTAGLDHTLGDAVVIIDADLQDPPELIPELVKHWMDGYDVVSARRIKREGESALKKVSAHAFYRVIKIFSRISVPEDTGDFRLLSRRAVDSLKQLREQHRFMKGLFAWIGYPQETVLYQRNPRFAGRTKWNYWRLWNFALEGITSFSTVPLRIATYLGIAVALCAFIYGVIVILKTLLYGDPVRGYPSLMVVILFLGGIQLICIGIVGEYLGRMFDESKGRPLYFINSYEPAETISETVSSSL